MRIKIGLFDDNEFLNTQALDNFLKKTNSFLGKAVGRGDCLFDSILQSLNEKENQAYGADDIPQLRELVHRYAIELFEKPLAENWIYQCFLTHAKSLSPENAEIRAMIEYANYITNIQFDANLEAEKDAIWGETHIDGRIFCNLYQQFQLHVMELHRIDGDIIMAHQLIDAKGSTPISEEKAISLSEDPNIIHIAICDLHYVPLLSSKTKSANLSCILEIQLDLQQGDIIFVKPQNQHFIIQCKDEKSMQRLQQKITPSEDFIVLPENKQLRIQGNAAKLFEKSYNYTTESNSQFRLFAQNNVKKEDLVYQKNYTL